MTGGGAIGYVLWALSFVCVALMVKFFITIRRDNILPNIMREQIGKLLDGRQYREAIEVTGAEGSLLSSVVHASLAEAANGYPAMERAMEEASEQQTTGMLRSIEWLNLIGNIGPMLGLMGTVLGMIKVFFTIVEHGSVVVDKLANGIGIALVTTLLGLAVAIPALAAYSILRNRIDALSSETMIVAQEIISGFRPGRRPSPAPETRPTKEQS
jgi:biopolymer transport protein ExbB